jgi:heme/copper-type cytochrome/quinol oxidase subunit 2
MRPSAIVLTAALFTVAASAAPGSAASHKNSAQPIINVVATADQKFSPDHIVLHVGKPATLHFSSSGGVHGIASPDLGIPATMLMPGKPVSFHVTPKKAATYKLPCTIVCGPNHADMALTIQVKP